MLLFIFLTIALFGFGLSDYSLTVKLTALVLYNLINLSAFFFGLYHRKS